MPPILKKKKEKGKDDIFVPPAGFPGLSTRLPLMYTAVKEGKLRLEQMVRLISENPARIFGLFPQKGVLMPGSDADLIIIDPNKKGVIDKEKMFTKCRDSAVVYDGWEVFGQPEKTIVRGQVVYEQREIKVEPGYGKIIKLNRK